MSMIKKIWQGFVEDNVMGWSSSIAFYTIFSMPPLLLILVQSTSYIPTDRDSRDEIYSQVSEVIGPNGANHVMEVLNNVAIQKTTWYETIISVAVLLFAATTVFVSIQNALNYIWHVKPKPKSGILKLLKDRLLSFALILTIGFLLLASLVIDALIIRLQSYISETLSGVSVDLIVILHNIVSFSIISVLFALMFQFLPDARLKWKNIRAGAIFTTVMFFIGKYLIAVYLGNSNLGSAYGAAGALVVVLVWVYYLSTLLLIGAEYTKAHVEIYGEGIHPSKNAILYKHTEIDLEGG